MADTKTTNAAIRAALHTNPLACIDTPRLVIGKGNTKTGASFTLPEGYTCPGKTKTCAATCYLGFGSFQFPAAKNSRNRNYQAVIALLKRNHYALADALIAVIKAAKTGSLRIHDGGDFFSPAYAAAWNNTVRNLPQITFWAYTRSWSVPSINAELVELASASNMKLWISADRDNYLSAIAHYRANPEYAGIAFMQLPGDEDISKLVSAQFPTKNVVIFPAHGPGGKHVDIVEDVPNCPAITKAIPESKTNPACLVCRKCL